MRPYEHFTDPVLPVLAHRRPWWLDALLDRHAWSRRRCGGHWERWIIDFPVCSEVWFQVEQCSRGTRQRPPLGRGTPVCEEW